MTYAEKLKDPRWQKKRLEILSRDDFSCLDCGERNATLHVHHRFYLSGKNPWDYDSKYLKTLCMECHKEETQRHDDLSKLLAEFPDEFMSDLHGALIDILTNPGKLYLDAWKDWMRSAHWQKRKKKGKK